MKGLKIAALLSAVLLIAALVMVGYLFLTAEVRITAISSSGTSASDLPEQFSAVRSAVQDGSFLGTLYQKPTEWRDASEYAFLTYTVTLQNHCLVPLDMLEVQIVPQAADILQIGDFSVHSIRQESEGSLQATILTAKDSHPVREVIVTYYVWGISFSVKSTYGI